MAAAAMPAEDLIRINEMFGRREFRIQELVDYVTTAGSPDYTELTRVRKVSLLKFLRLVRSVSWEWPLRLFLVLNTTHLPMDTPSPVLLALAALTTSSAAHHDAYPGITDHQVRRHSHDTDRT